MIAYWGGGDPVWLRLLTYGVIQLTRHVLLSAMVKCYKYTKLNHAEFHLNIDAGKEKHCCRKHDARSLSPVCMIINV